MAPATLNRSVICVFISALRFICSREIACRPRADPLGRDDEQRQHHERQQREPPLQREHRGQRGDEHDHVRHDRAERAGDAPWAPITSLFSRLMRAPVWVRVKNATGMRCTLSNRAARRS